MNWLIGVLLCAGFFCLGCAVTLTLVDVRESGRRGGYIEPGRNR